MTQEHDPVRAALEHWIVQAESWMSAREPLAIPGWMRPAVEKSRAALSSLPAPDAGQVEAVARIIAEDDIKNWGYSEDAPAGAYDNDLAEQTTFHLPTARRILTHLSAARPVGGTPEELCGDCPPVGYPTDKTRCLPCPRRSPASDPRVAEAVEALREIAELEKGAFDFPADWSEQVRACVECQSYKDHPIQQGICNRHRQPLWAREAWEKSEDVRIGFRAKRIASAALASLTASKDAG